MPAKSGSNRFLRALIAGYAILWFASAIGPRDWPTWSLENLPVVLVVVALFASFRRFRFSDRSYLLIALFLALHTIGAHWGYAHTPFGNWLKDEFALRRNYYDRLVHGCFGLLLAYPFREILLRSARLSPRAASWFSIALVAAASAAFEVAEALLAEAVSPGTGPEWLGAQGDEWDSQQDMLIAVLGAAAATLATWWSGRTATAPGRPS